MKAKQLHFLFVFTAWVVFSAFASRSSTSAQALNALIQKIESYYQPWVALDATLSVHFRTAQDKQASCQGQLSYQRLDQYISLGCRNARGEFLFGLQTTDDDFQLHLPRQKRLVEGNILDLENSEQIESHIKPLEYYRAFTPLPFRPESAELVAGENDTVAIRVYAGQLGKSYLSRLLWTTLDGFVFREIYYASDGKPTLRITRSDLRKTYANTGNGKPVYFPHLILIESLTKETTTELLFEKVRPLDALPGQLPRLVPRPDTEIIRFPVFNASMVHKEAVYSRH